jgi:ribosome-binding ATPase YchF (GTP1/OBG family)
MNSTLLIDPISDVKALKKELKQWESAFLKREGRKARKDDISKDKAISKR